MAQTAILATFASQPLKAFESLEGMRYFTERLFGARFHFTDDPDLASEILLSRDFYHDPMVYNQLRPITGRRGMVQLPPEEGAQLRERLRPLLDRQGLEILALLIDEELATLGDHLRAREREGFVDLAPDDIFRLMWRITFRYMTGCDEVGASMEMFEAFKVLNHHCGRRMRSPFSWPLWLPTRQSREIARARRLITRIFQDLYARRCERLSILSLMSGGPGSTTSSSASVNDIVDQLTTLIWAGHETTACGVLNGLHEIANDNEEKEQEGALLQKVADDPKFATQVFKESIRLHPPAYMLVRKVTRTHRRRGHLFRNGDHVVITLFNMHRREDFFTDPLTFKPWRFADKANPKGFLPFGLGAKRCFGERLSYFEGSRILHQFCRKYTLIRTQALHHLTDITLQPAPDYRLRLRRKRHDSTEDL